MISSEAARDAGAPYQLRQRAGVMCEQSSVPQGLRLHESPLCALASGPLCESPIECHRDEECQERAHGRCIASVDGVCIYPMVPWSKRYTRCTQDAECKELTGGRCEQKIVGAYCEYDECESDGECHADERCVCQAYFHVCMKVECQSDAECPAGERCIVRSPCAEIISGYNCTTPEDECRTDSDCKDPARSSCDFHDGRFRCGAACIVDVIARWR